MKDKIYYGYNKVINAETKYLRLMEAIDEAQRNFLRARLKGETFKPGSQRQYKIFSRKWKKIE